MTHAVLDTHVHTEGNRGLHAGKYKVTIGDVVSPAAVEFQLTGATVPLPTWVR